jgi:hypothetical protein
MTTWSSARSQCTYRMTEPTAAPQPVATRASCSEPQYVKIRLYGNRTISHWTQEATVKLEVNGDLNLLTVAETLGVKKVEVSS